MILNRRGQIRGIDFSLAMIIYILVMTQIIVLTSSLLQNNQQIVSIGQRNNEINGISLQIRESQGSPKNWNAILSSNLSNDWTFGLSDLFSDGIDATKLGRLSNFSAQNYKLEYNQIKGGLNNVLGNRSFSIETKYGFEITKVSVENIGFGFRIRGEITKNDQKLNGTLVYIFGIAGNETANSGMVQSAMAQEEDGNYIGNLQFSFVPSWAKIITIAQYGGIFEAVNVVDYGTISNSANISLVEKLTTTSPYNILVQIDGTKSSYDHYAFHISTGNQTGGTISNLNVAGLEANYTVPQKGIVVVLVINNSDTVPEIGVQAFPIALGSELSSKLEPLEKPSGTFTVTNHLIYCRGILMDFIFTLWDDFT